nr:PspC domain-containing protein [uncultured Oscillibacter sp.]
MRKLYRARSGRMLEGVCAGIANYFALDPTLVRLGWVLFTAIGCSGIVAYIICALLIPEEPER